MLKIVATGNLTRDVELKLNKNSGKPYAILRIASDRRYRNREGIRRTEAFLDAGLAPEEKALFIRLWFIQ